MILLMKFYEGLRKLVRVEVRGGVQRAEEETIKVKGDKFDDQEDNL